jgi:hypothetical protein
MRRGFTFTSLGKGLILLGSVFHAGCVLPIAHVLCVLLCLQGMSIVGDPTAKFDHDCSAMTADSSDDVNSNDTTATDLMLVSHISGDWAPAAIFPMTIELAEVRFEAHAVRLDNDVPHLSHDYPPPKTSSLRQI